MEITGITRKQTFGGEIIEESTGLMVPMIIKIYLDNPMLFNGKIVIHYKCLLDDGQIIEATGTPKELSIDKIPMETILEGGITFSQFLLAYKDVVIKIVEGEFDNIDIDT